jgi:peptidyl-prolyl cis-trans isomerase D
MYTPKWMLEKENAVLAQPLDFDFVMIPFASIKNEEVTITDADLTAYINKNKEEYKREPSASIAYVEFDIKPSAADSLEVRKEVERMAEGLRTAKNDSLYINSQRGEYTGMFVNKKGLEGVAIKDSLDKIAIGTVVGPYLQGVEYKVAKLIDRKTVADSVRSRHILIKPEGDLKKTQAKADSLKALIETGKARFDSLAAKFGTDATVAKGGDLGYGAWGSTVPEFNNLIFTKAQIGKIYTVTTQFGIHIIEVTGVKGSQTIYKMGSLGKKIHPSQTTHDAVFAEASKFLGENSTKAAFDASIKAKNFAKRIAGNLGVNGFAIQPLNAQATQSSSREIIRWAHREGAVGQIATKPYEYTDPTEGYINKYIVVMLTGKSTQGIASLEEVREEVTAKVTNLKKAEKIKAKIQGTDLDAIATAFTAQKQTATGATILNSLIPSLSRENPNINEPRVVATAARLEPQKTEVVTGNAGVCVIKLTNKGQVNPIVDLNAARRQTSNRYAASVNYSLFEALKKNARITDNRDKFY